MWRTDNTILLCSQCDCGSFLAAIFAGIRLAIKRSEALKPINPNIVGRLQLSATHMVFFFKITKSDDDTVVYFNLRGEKNVIVEDISFEDTQTALNDGVNGILSPTPPLKRQTKQRGLRYNKGMLNGTDRKIFTEL